MKTDFLHTPDGVRDIYNGECRRKLIIQDILHNVLKSYGYQDIQTPTFEFFDVFGREIGTTPSKDLYKFFDKEGNTLVLRPDFTPSIARSAAKYYSDEDMPIKLCYMGNAYINYTDYKGRLKESTQCGAELMGEASVFSDAEILSMVVECLKACGLREFQISVGHAEFFRGLIEAAQIDEEAELQIRTLLRNKNFFGVEEYVETLNIPLDLIELFSLMGQYNVSDEVLVRAKTLAKNYPTIQGAIDNLLALSDYLKTYGIDKYVSFEMGIVSEYKYYTGILFSAYTFGTGEAIVNGGRYDKLLSYFGKNKPAIGFGIFVDQLMAALSRQKIEINLPKNSALIVFQEAKSAEAIRRSAMLRGQGLMVQTILWDNAKTKEDYFAYANKHDIDHVEFLDGEQ